MSDYMKTTTIVLVKMDLFIAYHTDGIQIARGEAPRDSIAVFPSMGRHLPKVLRCLPEPLSEGIYEVTPCLALNAIAQCVKPLTPSDLTTAFRECLLTVDKLNTPHHSTVESWAESIFGDDYRAALRKAGVCYLKKDRFDSAYKLLHGGRSSWIRVDPDKAKNVVRLARERTRSPHRGLDQTPSASSQDTLSDGDR
jgi:hypothetical protein